MKKVYTIGRGESCDIVIADTTDVISRLHATIRVESNGKIYLIDQSRNGTYVNGMKMSSKVEIPVTRQDVISFAHIYNLDWSLVPKPKKGYLNITLIILSSVIAIAGLGYMFLPLLKKNMKPKQLVPVVAPMITPEPEMEPEPEEVIKFDTVAVKDTVKVDKKENHKQKPVKEPKDTVKVEKKKEKIYNPIY